MCVYVYIYIYIYMYTYICEIYAYVDKGINICTQILSMYKNSGYKSFVICMCCNSFLPGCGLLLHALGIVF